jgi:hypothetical protein
MSLKELKCPNKYIQYTLELPFNVPQFSIHIPSSPKETFHGGLAVMEYAKKT